MGIRKLLVLTLALAPIASKANSVNTIFAACRAAGGTIEKKDIQVKGDQECYKIKCSYSSGGAADNMTISTLKAQYPEASGALAGAWTEACVEAREIDDILDLNAEGGLVIPGGGGINVDGTIVVDGVAWPATCVKRNGKIKRACRTRGSSNNIYVRGGGGGGRRGGGGLDVDGGVDIDIDGSGGRGRGGKTVVVIRNGRRITCTYEYHPDECGAIIDMEGGVDCANCTGGGRRHSLAYELMVGAGALAQGVLPSLAAYGIHKNYANAWVDVNNAWAGAAGIGFEQCALMQQTYITETYAYINGNELPDRSVVPPGCEGYQVGGFAGGLGMMGGGGYGMGYGNPWYSAGYTPGFIGGMVGPYGGGTNPYAGPGFNIGMYGSPYGGYGMGGMGGYPGYPGYGMGMGGYPGSGAGIGINLGLGGGGMGMGGYPYGGYGMGYGNPTGYGVMPWGNGSGSYWNGSGGWNGNTGIGGGIGIGVGGGMGMGGYPYSGGGYSGSNWGNIYSSYQSNAYANQYDQYLQQSSVSGQPGMGGGAWGGNMWGTGYSPYGYQNMNYGYAPYSPMNMGLSLNGYFGLGF